MAGDGKNRAKGWEKRIKLAKRWQEQAQHCCNGCKLQEPPDPCGSNVCNWFNNNAKIEL